MSMLGITGEYLYKFSTCTKRKRHSGGTYAELAQAEPGGKSFVNNLAYGGQIRSGNVQGPKAVGFRRISIDDLDWRPRPLPDIDA